MRLTKHERMFRQALKVRGLHRSPVRLQVAPGIMGVQIKDVHCGKRRVRGGGEEGNSRLFSGKLPGNGKVMRIAQNKHAFLKVFYFLRAGAKFPRNDRKIGD